MILVIALNHTAYELYLEKHSLKPTDCKWVRRAEHIRGHSTEVPVVAVGNWYENRDRTDAKIFAREAGFTVTEERV